VKASLVSPLKQRKILYCCSSLKWFDLLHTIPRLMLRLKQGAFQVKCPCRKKCRQSLFLFIKTQKRVLRAMLLHGQLTTWLQVHECERLPFCISPIHLPSSTQDAKGVPLVVQGYESPLCWISSRKGFFCLLSSFGSSFCSFFQGQTIASTSTTVLLHFKVFGVLF
jgi:hypothetical protein